MAKKITVFALLALILLINIGYQGTAPEEQTMTRDRKTVRKALKNPDKDHKIEKNLHPSIGLYLLRLGQSQSQFKLPFVL